VTTEGDGVHEKKDECRRRCFHNNYENSGAGIRLFFNESRRLCFMLDSMYTSTTHAFMLDSDSASRWVCRTHHCCGKPSAGGVARGTTNAPFNMDPTGTNW
jgi:hypothetical protein